MDATIQFREAIKSAGLVPPEVIQSDGKLHRFASNGDRGDHAGWYTLHSDGIPAGAFGDWRTGISETWQCDIGRTLTPVEEAAHRAKVDAMRREREAKETRDRAKAARNAGLIWTAATTASDDHPYLLRKGVSPVPTLREIDASAVAEILCYAPKSSGQELAGRLLVVPIKVGDLLSTCELIDGEGRKSALYGGAKAGGYWAAQPLPSGDGNGQTMLLGEGVATVLSGKAASGHPAIGALASGNLAAVAKAMRERYPAAVLVLLADLVKATGAPDHHAIDAARSIGGLVAIPNFGADRDPRMTDLNDLARVCGTESVRSCIAGAKSPAWGEHQNGNGILPKGIQDWPEPIAIPDALPPVTLFDYDMLPNSLRGWVRDIAERVQCPADFPAVGAMISLTTVVGRKIGIRPKRQDDWLEVPNLWGAVIGRPGVMKSPALREAMRPLRNIEQKALNGFEEDLRAWQRQQELAKLRREAEKIKIRKAYGKGDAIDSDALTDELDEEPHARRYVCNDCSVEALGEILRYNPNGTLAYRDELIGLLKSLDKEGNEGARGFFLSAWSGTDGYTFDRIGRGLNLRIEACCLSLLGSIQPAVIGGYLRQAVAGGGADGLLSRFQLLVWPDISGDWRDVDRLPDSNAKETAYSTFDRLDTLDPSAIGAITEDGVIPYLRFDDAAQDLFTEWRTDFEPRIRSGDEHPAFEAHLAKYRKLVPVLALLIHLADNGHGAVGETALLKALAWAEYLESHARRAYASVMQAESESARALLQRIRRGDVPDPFVPRNVYLKHWAYLSTPEETYQAVRLLTDLDWLLEEREETGGRPKVQYRTNPKAKPS